MEPYFLELMIFIWALSVARPADGRVKALLVLTYVVLVLLDGQPLLEAFGRPVRLAIMGALFLLGIIAGRYRRIESRSWRCPECGKRNPQHSVFCSRCELGLLG